LSTLKITIIECGPSHVNALTENSEVYAWGRKHYSKIGKVEIQYDPIKLIGFGEEKIIMISCGSKHSMALTASGRVYGWGSNEWGQLGLEDYDESIEPKIVNLNCLIKKICCGNEHSLLLTNNGLILAFGVINSENDEISKIKISFKINKYRYIDILSHHSVNIIASLSEDNVYFIWKPDKDLVLEPVKTRFKSFDEIVAEKFEINLKPIKKLINFYDPFLREDYYKENFNELIFLGEGSFGNVYKVEIRALFNGKSKLRAIKKIKISQEEEKLREYLNFHKVNKLDSKYVVQHYDAWFEKGDDNNILYIEMKLCEKTLEDLICELCGKMDTNEILTPLAYSIASQIFIELLEGVKYLHEQNPPLIHRDLKPANILLKESKNSGRLVKIADFGLIVLHEYSDQPHTMDRGSPKYTAPEVMESKNYDTKADIYSLGEIMKNLFNIQLNMY
jgi:hypothetical protein